MINPSITPEMFCELMSNPTAIFQAMMGMSQEKEEQSASSSLSSAQQTAAFASEIFGSENASSSSEATSIAQNPNPLVGAALSTLFNSINSDALVGANNISVGDVLAQMVNLNKRAGSPIKPTNAGATKGNPLAVPNLETNGLKRRRAKPPYLGHTVKKVRELKSELLAQTSDGSVGDQDIGQIDNVASALYYNGGTVGEQLTGQLARKLKKPRVTKAQDTQPLSSIAGKSTDRELLELESFAQNFKQQRIKHGFTQGDVGVALGKRYGTDFSQTTISRFEALNLSFKNMCKLRPLLKEWLEQTEAAIANGASVADILEASGPAPFVDGSLSGGQEDENTSGEHYHAGSSPKLLGSSIIPPLKKRRKRTNLDNSQRAALSIYFEENCRPDHNKMVEIAESLDLEPDVVRVWFCNRRQKLRKVADEVEVPLQCTDGPFGDANLPMC